MTEAVAAVHAAGGRVAVHCQTAEGSRNAVLVGADSLEHGMHLGPALLDLMARQGASCVPTLGAFAGSAEVWRGRERSAKRSAWLEGWVGRVANVRAAHEAGVTVLAGTDTFPCGTVAAESRHSSTRACPPRRRSARPPGSHAHGSACRGSPTAHRQTWWRTTVIRSRIRRC
ncbi:hypothetical protein [Streptomyces sp. CS227]|uniref:hypothetical protein n=1 Tax=Streptomyces sp. CS227 TaxID=1982763 RepID=UPI00211B44DD|nr:hypothetical protein [Streptomyces sp. CS227]